MRDDLASSRARSAVFIELPERSANAGTLTTTQDAVMQVPPKHRALAGGLRGENHAQPHASRTGSRAVPWPNGGERRSVL
jgi:hypothetical protein